MSILIHVGYPRAGSTYLQTWFSQNPSFHYKPNGIGGFSNLNEMAQYAQNSSQIHNYFVVSSEDLSIWKGDFDIVGFRYRPYDILLYKRNILETLYSLFPKAKVLIITRGFSSLIKSLYSQYIISGGTLSFKDFQKENRTILSVFCNYTDIVKSYRELFGAENLIVLPYELLKENPKAFTSLIEEELNVKDDFEFTNEKINASPTDIILSSTMKLSNLVFKTIQPLPYSYQKRIYEYYIYHLNKKNLDWCLKLFSKIFRNDIETEVTKETLKLFSGMSEIFRTEKLYKPYLGEYLID